MLGAAYMLLLYQRTMFGKVENPKNEQLPDLSIREFATFAPLIVLAVWIGLYPAPFLRRLDTSVQHVIARVSPQYTAAQRPTARRRQPSDAGAGGGRRAARRQPRAASSWPRIPCGRDGKPLPAAGAGQTPRGALMPPGIVAQRLLLHPAGDRAHGRRAARAGRPTCCCRAGSRRARPGSRWRVLGATLASLVPFVGVRRRGRRNGLLAVDQFALFFKVVFLVAAAITVLMSVRYLEIEGASPGEYYFLILCATLGMMIMAGGIDLITSFIGLETMAVSFYILAGFIKPNQRSNEAAVKYFLLGAFSLGILLYGMSLLYGLSGTTNLRVDGDGRSSGASADPLLVLAVILVVAGMGFKIAAVPFHMWAPDVYEGAPTPVTAFLSVGSKAASFAMLLRIFVEGLPSMSADWRLLFEVLAIVTMTVGNVAALTQIEPQADAGVFVDRARRLPADRRRGRDRRAASRRC